MVDFQSIFFDLEDLGVYDYVLPFLLVFTILFAVLEKTKLLGTEEGGKEPRRNLNVVLALVISLIVVVRTDITSIMNNYLSKMALFIIVVLIFILTTGLFGASTEGYTGTVFFIAMILSVLAVIWALSGGLNLGLPDWLTPTEQDRSWILLIAIMFLVIWFITKKPRVSGQQSVIEKIIEGFKGK